MTDSSEPGWQPFHQAEALVTRLANILDEYPAGPSTLREFVQNADDAGATRLVLCLDEGSGDTCGELPTDGLAQYARGPALLVYNNAEFSERDFESISSIGRSRKRDDSTTIGKYGLGFNVAYHFTDCVQFVSGESVVIFDPQQTQKHFARHEAMTTEQKQAWVLAQEQLPIVEGYGCGDVLAFTGDRHLHGT